MVGADSVVKLIAATVFMLVLLFIVGVGFTLAEPIFNQVLDQSLMGSLGWGDPGTVALLFMGLGLVGLGLVVILWWIVGWVRDDVRQDRRVPPY